MARDLSHRGFWQVPRHRLAGFVLGLLALVAVGANLLASDLPLYVELDGRSYVLACVTRPAGLGGLRNADLEKLVGGRVRHLVQPPVPFGPLQTDITVRPLSRPDRTHWLGTDRVGRDVLARLIHGARTSLAVGLLATALAALVGLGIGALAGFTGGWTAAVLGGAMEVVQTFPVLFLLLGVMALAPDAGLLVLIAVLGLTRWIEMGRLARAEAMRVRAQEYVLAARALGSTARRIFFVHVLPAALGPVLVSASLEVGTLVLIESALSFLGFGVPAPTASWGELLSQARSQPGAWWLAVAPGVCIFAVVAACNVLGEGAREAASRGPEASAPGLPGR